MRTLIICLFIASTGLLLGQEVSVSPSLFGLQLGGASVSAHGEFKIGAISTLRLEASMALGALVYDGDDLEDIEFFLFPVISVESRRYYNLAKRQFIGKNTYKNSANFYSLFISHQPRKFSSRGNQRIRFSQATSIFVRWGLKRNFGEHFTMETFVGPGVVLYDFNGDQKTLFRIMADFRIGYTF